MRRAVSIFVQSSLGISTFCKFKGWRSWFVFFFLFYKWHLVVTWNCESNFQISEKMLIIISLCLDSTKSYKTYHVILAPKKQLFCARISQRDGLIVKCLLSACSQTLSKRESISHTLPTISHGETHWVWELICWLIVAHSRARKGKRQSRRLAFTIRNP